MRSGYRTGVAAVLLLAAVLRLQNLDLLPPFIDESRHIHFAQHYEGFPLTERLREGKVFGYFVFFPTARFAPNPLYATRCVNAILGVATTLGVIVLTRRLSSIIAALLAGALWAAMPYVVFHDRMALHDPIVSACVVWSMVALAVALDRDSWAIAAVAGLLSGAAVLAKLTAIVCPAWPMLVLVAPRGWAEVRRRLTTLAAFVLALGVPAVVMVLGLARWGSSLAPQYLRAGEATTWKSVWLSVVTATTWFAEYNSVPFTILAGATLVSGTLGASPVRVGLAVSFLGSLIGYAVLLKQWFPRYLLPLFLLLVVLMAMEIADWAKQAAPAIGRRLNQRRDWKPLGATLAAALLLAASVPYWVHSDAAFARDPHGAVLPPLDRYQYLIGWPSGYGLTEVAAFLNHQARQSGTVLVIVGGPGELGSWSLPIGAKLDPRIVLRSESVASRMALVRAAADAQRQPTFILFEPPRYGPPAEFALASPRPTLVFEYKRPQSEEGYQLYALAPFTHVAAEP